MSNEHDNGGLPDLVFKDLAGSFALATEEEYPYTASYKGICVTRGGHVRVKSFKDVDNTPVALKRAIVSGPVSVAVQADSREFQLYKSGVFDRVDCFGGQLDHAVLGIGFGVD